MKKDELVEYNNDLNKIPLKGFKAIDIDILMVICQRCKNKGTELLIFSFAELKAQAGLSHQSNAYFKDELQKVSKKLKEISGSYSDSLRFEEFSLFSTFYGTLKEEEHIKYGHLEPGTFVVRVNPDYEYILNYLDNNFTAFELKEFISLESKHSKNLYRLLKRYKDTGKFWTHDIEGFRELMGCPKSYKNKYFADEILAPSIKELTAKGIFVDLKMETERDATKRGRPIVKYSFTFKVEEKDQEVAKPQEDKPKRKPRKPKEMPKNRFNNFEERTYDFVDLEARLTQKSIERNQEG